MNLRNHKMAIAAIVFFCFILLMGGVYLLPALGIKASPIPVIEYSGIMNAGELIAKESGEIKVAESSSKELYIDTTTLGVKIKDKTTKTVWNSFDSKAQNSLDKALLALSYLGEDNNLYEWDSYANCTEFGDYTIFSIENGVQIHLNINEGESERFYEYYPEKMTIERFEVFFLEGIASLVETGKLEQEVADRYKMTLELLYKRSIMEECYAVTYNGTPPRSAVKQLIELARLLGYSKEMLLEDSEAMGLSVSFVEPAAFTVVVELSLANDDLLVRVPTQAMVSENPFYTIQNIKVLPNFGAKDATDDGYILVPDGAGALFRFNTFNPSVVDYKRPIYDNDYFSDYYYMPEYAEELMMPIFGMIYGQEEDTSHGFLGIIEKGAETSFIHNKLASTQKENPSTYNKVYASFDVTQYSYVKVYGPYSENQNTYLADTGAMEVDYTIRYKLFPEQVSYYDMAMAYRDYLKEEWEVSQYRYPEELKLYLDFIGTVSLTERILGIPYTSPYSMTSYQELSDILTDLDEMSLAVEYSGVFHGGMENHLYRGADLVKANGTKKELQDLMEKAEASQVDFFLESAMTRIYDQGKGYFPKIHGIYDYSNSPATVFGYSSATGKFNYQFFDVEYYSLLSPRFLDSIMDQFLEEAKEYPRIAVLDLAHENYPDYRFNKNITIFEAAAIVEKNLEKMAGTKELSLHDPLMKNLRFAEYATDISRESSDYMTMATTIPFRQLVMNGLAQVTTQDVNMSSSSSAYYVLQSIELGMYPKFTLTSKSVDVLKDSSYSDYYSTEYAKLKEILSAVYEESARVWDQIGSMEITDHRILGDQVFWTRYASGTEVITNYNLHPVIVEGVEIEALGYRIQEGKEE